MNTKYFFAALIFIFLMTTNLWAQDFSMDYELPEQIPVLGPGGAFEIGYFWPALGDLNQELKSMGLGGVGGGAVYGGTIGYSFNPSFQIAYEGLGFSGSSSGIVSGTVKSINLSAGSSNLFLIYKFPWGKSWNVSLGIAPGYYQTNYTKEITSGPYQYGDNQTPQNATTSISRLSGSAWGAKIAGNFKYILNPIISLGFSLGWQYAKIKELYQSGVQMPQAPIIDLSGFSIKVGAHLNF